MKKLFTLLALCAFSGNVLSQATSVFEAPQNNITTTQLRAPNGLSTSAYMRAAALVLQTELTYIPSSTTLTSFGFTLSTSSNMSAPVTGNFTVYLENTSDVTYNKGTSWPTIITGMSTCYASVISIPQSLTTTSVMVTLSTPFVYTGGGLYVAYDWYSSGPYSTAPATFWSESAALTTGCASSVSASSAPTTLGTSNFRPSFLFGFSNPYTNDVRVTAIEAPGRIAAGINGAVTPIARVENISSTTATNVVVTASLTGPNSYINTITIPSLAAGATTVLTFAPYTPANPGAQTLVVTSAADMYNPNNTKQYLQEVTCDIWGQGPATNTYTYTSVGFNTGSGIISTPYANVATNTLVGLRGAVSTNTPAVGNVVYGVLLSSTGAILASSSNVTITAAMLGTFVNFNFATPQVLSPATTYYFGFAQTANTALGYFPAGTYGTNYLQPNLYYVTALTGGALTPIANNFGFFGIEGVFNHTVNVSATSQTVNCGASAVLTATSNTNYNWSTGASTSSISVTTATTTSQFTVSATNTLGCTSSKVVTLTVLPLPLSIAVSPTLVCAGNTVSLTAGGAANFTWSAGSTATINGAQISDAPTSNTSYSLAAADPNGCASNTVFALTVNPLPNVNLSSTNASVCAGNTIALFASGSASTYSWSTGQTGSSITPIPASNTTYSLFGFSALGCVKTVTTGVTVDSFTPTVTSSTAICEGQSIQLTATGATTVLWNTGSVFSSISVTPGVTTSYTVTGRGPNSCVGSAITTVSVNPTPSLLASASRTSICKGEKSVLTATGATSYTWSTGASGFSLSLTPTIAIQQTYSVTGNNEFGCESTTTVSLKVNACTGIESTDLTRFVTVYPNPAKSVLTLVASEELVGSFARIYATNGQCVGIIEISSDKQTIEIDHYAAGVYNLVIDGKAGAIRIIKEN